MREFSDKSVLITGASEGIGRATARVFATRGADLILVARNEQRLDDLKRELVAAHDVKVQIHPLDLRDAPAVDAFFSKLEKQGEPFDFAVNNAGFEGRIADLNELNMEDYEAVFDVNVRAVWQCLKHEITHFRGRKKAGAIVNVASILGFMGIAGSSLYVASKHAVIGFTKAAAVEQSKHGIRVNCVSPGATDTPMIRRVLGRDDVDFVGLEPSQRMTAPEEIARSIAWLCSTESQNIIGHNLVIDGGRTVQVG